MKARHLILMLACAMMCTSCDPKLDFNNIDPTVKVGAGVCLPIGEMQATVGDFIGQGKSLDVKQLIYDKGVLTFVDTMTLDQEFHAIDLTQYVTDVHDQLKVGKYVPGTSIPAGVVFPVEFPLGVKLNNINDVSKLTSERLDSMRIDSALFTAWFNPTGISLSMNDVEKIELILPSVNFRRAQGNVLTLFDQTTDSKQFGDALPVKIDAFTINLMKDPAAAPSVTNVTDSVTFYVKFYFRCTTPVTFDSDSHIEYDFRVNLIDYEAVYGYFQESNKMHEDTTIHISDRFKEWNDLKNLKLPIYNPSLKLALHHSIGAPLHARIDTLAAIDDATGKMEMLKFGGSTHMDQDLMEYVKVNDPFDKVVTDSLRTFDRENGETHRLFEIRPDKIYYKFSLSTRPGEQQHRLTKTTKVGIDAILKVPFMLNKGTSLGYQDTIDVNMSEVSLDSLLADIEMVDSLNVKGVHLVLTTTSTLPFDVEATATFMDSLNNDLGINVTSTGKTIKINGLAGRTAAGVLTPGTSVNTIAVDQALLQKLGKTRKLYLDASAHDMTDNGNVVYPVDLNKDTKLSVKIAVTADVEAYLRAELNKK